MAPFVLPSLPAAVTLQMMVVVKLSNIITSRAPCHGERSTQVTRPLLPPFRKTNTSQANLKERITVARARPTSNDPQKFVILDATFSRLP